uniref:hypothetical protein n=1 Tax=Enterobacter asburiae TaxID=61645 RepID=UPI0010AF5848|nr:hypothetical protein [Enterobacter asburiae]
MPDALQTDRPGKIRLCLSKGYNAGWLKKIYEPHTQSRKKSQISVKRWTSKPITGLSINSWMNRFHRILTRWKKKPKNYKAILRFTSGLIIWNKLLLR